MKNILKLVAIVFIAVFAYFLLSSFFLAIKLPPAGGDSYWYHVPIARNILNGNFLFQRNIIEIEQWYPGSSEGILAIFIFLHLPVNLFNIFAILLFSVVLYKFGNAFLKDKVLSIVFACSLVISYGVFRLAISQNIDIWVAIYYLILIMLFEKPKDSDLYFFATGFVSGMLIGSKYAAPIFFLVLLLVYGKQLLKHLNLKRAILFLIPFTIFGLFWYIRNLALTGSPFYPQSILFFKGLPGWHSYLSLPIWKAIVKTPGLMINAFISEFMLWPALYLVIPLYYILARKFKKKYSMSPFIKRILIIACLGFVIYLFLPYDNLYQGMVLSIRYIYSLFILLALVVFLIAQKLKMEKILAVTLLSEIAVLLIQPYHPKEIFVLAAVLFVVAALITYRTKLLRYLAKYLPL
jgi:hypothetical protein